MAKFQDKTSKIKEYVYETLRKWNTFIPNATIMTSKSISVFALFALLMLSACKKDNPFTNNIFVAQNPLMQGFGVDPEIPKDANGALYAINHMIVSQDSLGNIDTAMLGSAYAWFGNKLKTQFAGNITCNTKKIEYSLEGTTFPWYFSASDFLSFTSNITNWRVTGEPQYGTANFSHNDTTLFPVCDFSVPSSISLNSNLSVNYSKVISNDGVYVSIFTDKEKRVTKTLSSGATSVTFSADEVKSVAASGEKLCVQVIPYKTVLANKKGKLYYFTKLWAYSQYTLVN